MPGVGETAGVGSTIIASSLGGMLGVGAVIVAGSVGGAGVGASGVDAAGKVEKVGGGVRAFGTEVGAGLCEDGVSTSIASESSSLEVDITLTMVLWPLGPAPCVAPTDDARMPTPMPNLWFPSAFLSNKSLWLMWSLRSPSPSSSESESSPSFCRLESSKRIGRLSLGSSISSSWLGSSSASSCGRVGISDSIV